MQVVLMVKRCRDRKFKVDLFMKFLRKTLPSKFYTSQANFFKGTVFDVSNVRSWTWVRFYISQANFFKGNLQRRM